MTRRNQHNQIIQALSHYLGHNLHEPTAAVEIIEPLTEDPNVDREEVIVDLFHAVQGFDGCPWTTPAPYIAEHDADVTLGQLADRIVARAEAKQAVAE